MKFNRKALKGIASMSSSLKRTSLISVALLTGVNSHAVLAKSVFISNSSFESGLREWVVTKPAKSSPTSRDGNFSAKLVDEGARIRNKVSVKPNTNYELTAFVKGDALFGVEIGSSLVETSYEKIPKGWSKLTVIFNSGSNEHAIIFATYKNEVGFIDGVKLKTTSDSASLTASKPKPQGVSQPKPSSKSVSKSKVKDSASNTKKKLNASLPPSGNFELMDWMLSIPTDTDGNEKADSIKERALSGGYSNDQFFYTNDEGAMVFKVPVGGYKTSKNTKFTRVELREMLRRGNTEHKTKGVGKNNWVFSSAPEEDQAAAGGVNGKLTGTVSIEHVTTTGEPKQVGRVVFAQIHATNDEPIRLYYRKLPNNEKGSIYFAHEPLKEKDIYFEMVGSRSSKAENPEDGIALGEKFSYEINVNGNGMMVKLFREGKAVISKTVNMSESGYDQGGQYMYFKAGAYIQDNTGEPDDYAEVVYYDLENSH